MTESDYRPLYHFTPPFHWMNDPNGLVYYKGTYHLFYQYNPNASVWGPMNWGHATSTDLFNWQDQPIALTPDTSGTIFSGSVVVDSTNTSGFKSGGEYPLVAVYTIAGVQQQQGIAYSNNGGMNWSKYAANPILPNPGVPDFRDPKVFWYAPAQKWIMVLAAGNKVDIYSSSDLKSWILESSFGTGTAGAQLGVWECPDLFPLTVEGTNTTKWVLLISCNGGPNGGTATEYYVGNFDGKNFTTETQDVLWIDYGTDNYADATYNNISATDGRRILIGWMSNWTYGQQVPTTSWRSTMTIPRVLSLESTGQSHVLKSNPVMELSSYENNTPDTTILAAQNSIQIQNNKIIQSGSYEIDFSIDLNTTNKMLLTLGNSSEKLTVSVDKGNSLITIDRSASGKVAFNAQFAQKILCPYIPKSSGLTDFQILVDKTSLELFVDNGSKVITVIFFPNYQYNFLKIQGDGSDRVISNFKLKEISKSLLR